MLSAQARDRRNRQAAESKCYPTLARPAIVAKDGRWQVRPAKMTPELILYSRASSSASYRARIALNLKQAAYTLHTLTSADQVGKSEYLKLNPQGLIPLLVHRRDGETTRLSQSVAILEFLEESYPDQGQHLLPTDLAGRARVRSLALHIACDMQPLNNTRVVKYIKEHLDGDSDTQKWSLHWAELGLRALEQELSSEATGKFCHGSEPTMADCCLVPQVFRATIPSVGVNLNEFPRVKEIYHNCLQLEAFKQAMPQNQPDAGS